MSISGPSGGSFTKLPGVTKDARALTDEQRRASEAEREASRRISQAYEQTKDAEAAARVEIEKTRDSFERQYVTQAANDEAALERQKTKGYEAVRDLQRNQQAELRRLRRDGEKDLASLQEYYRNNTYNTERKGKQDLQELQGTNHRRIEFERSNAGLEFDQLQSANTQKLQHAREQHLVQLEQLKEGSRRHYEQVKESTLEADQMAEKKFRETYESHLAQQQETLDSVQSKAKVKLDEIRENTSAKLAAYATRQGDPFYKIVDMDASLRDRGDHYVLTATIPEHEQEHVSVSIKGNNIVLSVRRTNEETQELARGRNRSTSSFQAFHESFPLKWPVEGREVRREFHGDRLVVIVPKKNEHAFAEPEHRKPEKVRVEAPHFPENLKIAEKKPQTDPPTPLKKSPGSGTLS